MKLDTISRGTGFDVAVCPCGECRLKLQEASAGSAPGGALVPVRCYDELYLRGNRISLRHAPLMRVGNLFGDVDVDHDGIRFTPFNIDTSGPHERSGPISLLSACLSDRFIGTLENAQKVNGVDAIFVSVGRTKDDMRVRMGFDPSRGYLPVYMSDRDKASGKRHHVAYMTEAKAVAHDRWFPMRHVKVLQPDSAPPFLTYILTVTALDVDKPIPDSMFELSIVKDSQVNVGDQIAWTQITEERTVTPADFPGLYAECIEVGNRYRERRGLGAITLASGEERESQSWISSWVLVGVASVVGVGAALLVRSLSKSRRRAA